MKIWKEKLEKLYNEEKTVSLSGLKKAVSKHLITPEEYEEISGIKYEAGD